MAVRVYPGEHSTATVYMIRRTLQTQTVGAAGRVTLRPLAHIVRATITASTVRRRLSFIIQGARPSVAPAQR